MEKFKWTIVILYKNKEGVKHTISFGIMAPDHYFILERLNDFMFNGKVEEIAITRD